MANSELQTYQPNAPQTFAPRTLSEAIDFANMIVDSGMAPKSYLDLGKGAVPAIVVAIQFGMEVGFQPMQALQCIANINGMPSVWGDGALALVRESGLLEYIQEDDFQTIKNNKKASCTVKRRGDPNSKTVTFSYEDAKLAGIFDRGVWKTYPYRMCMFRARGFALRDVFPDVLKGLRIAEEVQDYIDVTPAAAVVVQDKPKPQGSIVIPAVESRPETQVVPEIDPEAFITKEQTNKFIAACRENGYDTPSVKAFMASFNPPIESSLKIRNKQYEECMRWARNEPENMDAEPVDE